MNGARRRRDIGVAVGLIVSVALLFLPLRRHRFLNRAFEDGALPFKNTLAAINHYLVEGFLVIFNLQQALSERRSMRHDLARLMIENRQLRLLEQENRELRAMLGFGQRWKYRLVAARVVSRGDITGWWQAIRLDKGSEHGVAENMAVIDGFGLVGRIYDVGPLSSHVLLITDPACRVSVRLAESGGYGIVKGDGHRTFDDTTLSMLAPMPPPRMMYAARRPLIRPGEEVVTSGLGDVFPEGLLVGRVHSTEADESGLHQEATITPAAQMGEIRYVFILIE